MVLLALAVAPGLAICLFIILKDRFNPEPALNLLVSFVLGMVAIAPAILLQTYLVPVLDAYVAPGLLHTFLLAFFIVGLSEEASKYAMVRFYAYPKTSFDEPFDGIVYGIMVSMGFATLENIAYVLQYGLGTALVRMFVSVPAHATFGVLMGYYIGKAKFEPGRTREYLRQGLLIAIFFHGIFDFFLFLQEKNYLQQYISGSILFLGAIVSFIIAVRLSRKAIRVHRDLSEQTYADRNNPYL